MPSEVRYPGPLTQPCAGTLAGAQTSSHRAPFPRRVGEEKRRRGLGLLFPKPGSHSAFLLERDRGSSEKRRARGVHAGTSERAGFLPRKARSRLSASNGHFAIVRFHRAKTSSRQAAATNLETPMIEGPGEKRTRPYACAVAGARTPSLRFPSP